MRITKTHRIMAFACAFTLLLSMLNLNMFAFANNTLGSAITKHTVITKIGDKGINKKLCDIEQLSDLGENNLFDQKTELGFYHTDESGTVKKVNEEPSNLSDIKTKLYDGNIDSGSFIGRWAHSGDCLIKGYSNDTDQTDNWWQVDVEFSNYLKLPKYFVMLARIDANFMSQHYAVFASTDRDTLYDSSNMIIDIKDSTARSGDKVDISGLNLNVKYLGIRFYHRGYHNNTCSGQFVTEIGLYGGTLTSSYNHTVYKSPNEVDEDLSKNRLIGNGISTAGFYNNGQKIADCNVSDSFFDGKLYTGTEKQWNISTLAPNGNISSDILNDIYQTDAYLQLETELSAPINNPEKFIILFHSKNNDNARSFRSQHYAVYASDKKSTLYDKPIFEITDSSNRNGDKVELSNRTDLTNISYVAIRFFNRGYGSVKQFISEIGFFGGQFSDLPKKINTPIKDPSQADITGQNILELGSASGGFYADGIKTGEYSKYGIDTTLGAWHSTKNESSCQNNKCSNDLEQKASYWQLQFSLTGAINNPERFIFLSHDRSDKYTSNHYAVFASSSASDLYNDENLLFEVKDTTSRYGDAIDLKSLGKELTGIRFLGIRFYHRAYSTEIGCSLQHIKLVGLYGGQFAEDTVKVKYFNKQSEYNKNKLLEDTKVFGSNLIELKTPYAVKVNGADPRKSQSLKALTDSDFTKHLDISGYKGQKDGKYDLIYKLDSSPDAIKQIKKFIFRGVSNDNSYADPYITGVYEVYAAVNYTELFASENMIYSYNYERDGAFRGQTVEFLDDIYARYVAVRIINPVTEYEDITYIYPRISEIAFLGTDAYIPDEKVVISEKMPVSVYTSDNNGNLKDISESLTLDQYHAISDNNAATGVDFSTNNNQLDIICNLLKDYRLSDIKVNTDNGAEYEIYAAKTFSELWNDSSKISNGDFSDSAGKIQGRYVRITFKKNQGEHITLKDMVIYGYANPLIKRYEHISYSLDSTKSIAFVRPNGTNDINSLEYIDASLGHIFDSNELTEGTSLFSGGESGKSPLNLLVNLQSLQNVNNISIYFPTALVRYQPTKVYVYLGETYEEAMNFSKTPDIVFDGLPELGKYYSEFKPALARYIRIEFAENNYNKGITDIIGEKNEDFFNGSKINLALAEVDIMGTSVYGMAGEDGALLSFEDTDTGIKWDVVALDENDVATNIYSSRLVKSTATNAQKASLKHDPYYKIIGDSLYGIEFYDVFGNVINNIAERNIRIKFPVESSANKLIGNAKENEVSVYDSYEANDSGRTYICVEDKYSQGMKFSLLELTDESDAYWNGVEIKQNDSDNNQNDFENSNNSAASKNNNENALKENVDTDKNNEPETRLVDAGTETKYRISYTSAPVWLIVLTCIEGILLLGAVTAMVVIIIKQKKRCKITEN